MPLIEGLGDEVTVVLGVLFLSLISLIAWFSTRTTELPFFSVIVVELSARAARFTAGSDNVAPNGGESSEEDSATTEEGRREGGEEESRDGEQGCGASEAATRTLGLLADSARACAGDGPRMGKDAPYPSELSSEDASSTVLAAKSCAGAECKDRRNSREEGEQLSPPLPNASSNSDSGEVTAAVLEQTCLSGGDQVVAGKEEQQAWADSDSPASQLCDGILEDGVGGTEKGDNSESSELVRLRTNSNEVRRRRLEFFKSRTQNSLPHPHSQNSQPQPPSRAQSTFFEPSPPTQHTMGGAGGERKIVDSLHVGPKEPESVGGVSGGADLPGNSADRPLQREPSGAEPGAVGVEEDVDGRLIRVRLKFLNDTNRLVRANPSDTLGHFRREHFAEELAENKLVRFIFNGRALQNDAHTLQACNIQDNSVVHCLVTRGATAESEGLRQPSLEEEVQLGSFVYWLFALVLGLLWYARVCYRHYFNPASTLMLGGITFLFLLAYAASFRTRHTHQHLE